MPAARSRIPIEDTKQDHVGTRHTHNGASNLKTSRKTGATVASGVGVNKSNPPTQPTPMPTLTTPSPNLGLNWSEEDVLYLHKYRTAYDLDTPPAFESLFNDLILSRPGIAQLSPTMAMKRQKRKVSKEQLANAVRKHFNNLGVSDMDVAIAFIYKVRNTDKSLRARTTPRKPK